MTMPSAIPASPDPIRASVWWARRFLGEALLVAAVVLVYWNSLDAPFLFDDDGAVLNNTTIRRLWPLSAALTPPTIGSATTGRPVVNLSYAINYALGGNDAGSYHAENLLIHAAAALALLGLMRRTLESRVWPASITAVARPLACMIAALWALHPLQTESVTCIAQRTESLCGLIYLTAFYCFARGAASARPRGWFALSVLTCWLGMGTKEVMATAPLVMLLYDRTFFAGSFAAAWRQRRGYYAALATSWLLLGWLVLAGGGTRGVSAGFGLGISWWSYLLKQCEALTLYLKLTFWPHPLVLDYGTAVVRSVAEVWWQGIIVLALLTGTGWALWRRPVLGFIGAWFFVILAPSSSIVPLVTQTMAEHRMYLPLAGLVGGLVIALHGWLGTRAWIFLGAAALVCGGLTVTRNRDYHDAVSIWNDTAEKCPLNARAHINLGIELGKTGQPQEALQQFARAIELNTEFVVSGHYHTGATCLELGRVADAIDHLQTAVRLAPDHSDAQFTLGNALVQAGRPAEAVAHYEQALRIKPAADAHCNLGVALARLDREAEAIAQYNLALQLQPDLAGAHYQLAKSLDRAGRPEEAIRHFTEALRLAPDQPEAQSDFGILLAQAGRVLEAIEHLRKTVQLKPGQAEAHANLGNALLLQGRLPEAIEQYETALRLKPGDERTQENLQLARDALRSGRE